jgi:hypothetical protein
MKVSQLLERLDTAFSGSSENENEAVLAKEIAYVVLANAAHWTDKIEFDLNHDEVLQRLWPQPRKV